MGQFLFITILFLYLSHQKHFRSTNTADIENKMQDDYLIFKDEHSVEVRSFAYQDLLLFLEPNYT